LMPRDTKYYFDAMHYTDEGARKMAEIITSSLMPYLIQTVPSFTKDSCSGSRTNSG